MRITSNPDDAGTTEMRGLNSTSPDENMLLKEYFDTGYMLTLRGRLPWLLVLLLVQSVGASRTARPPHISRGVSLGAPPWLLPVPVGSRRASPPPFVLLARADNAVACGRQAPSCSSISTSCSRANSSSRSSSRCGASAGNLGGALPLLEGRRAQLQGTPHCDPRAGSPGTANCQ